jgi:hypothetical protein
MSSDGTGAGRTRMRANETLRLVPYGQATAPVAAMAWVAGVQTEYH